MSLPKSDGEILRHVERDVNEIRTVTLPKMEARIVGHGERLTKLEQFKFMVIGALAVVSTVLVPVALAATVELLIRG